MRWIKNAKLVLERGILPDGVLALEDGRIAALGEAGSLAVPMGAETLDAEGRYVGPGFVDIHVHGAGERFLHEAPEAVLPHFVRHGETTLLAALYYDLSPEAWREAIDRVRTAMGSGLASRVLAGLYMEGPYMNPRYGGGAERNRWRGPVRPEEYEPMVRQAGALAKIWAVAPEREGLEPFLQYAREWNPETVFSVGHSQATAAQVRRLRRYGLRLQTHCMNATGRPETRPGTRSAGPDEACLLDPDLYAEVICDARGVHVPPELLELILRVKGVERTILITDSFVGRGGDTPDLTFDERGALSGSRLTMDAACRNLMRHTACGICQAFLMASRNPARLLGLEDELGTLEPGKRANLVLMDDLFHVSAVLVDGIPAETLYGGG